MCTFGWLQMGEHKMTLDKVTITRRGMMTGAAGAAVGLAAGGALPATTLAAAPKSGPAGPAHYRFDLGAFEVTTILDGVVRVDGPHPIFGQNVSDAEVRELAAQNFLPPDKMAISFTPMVVNTGGELVLFDTGNGAGRRPDAGKLASLLGSAGFQPEQIDLVVISHFHPDHIGGLIEDGQPLFPNARYVTGGIEYDFWSPQDRLTGPTERVATLVQANIVPLAEKITFLKEGDAVVPGIEAIAAFGHTPGHMAFHIESEGARLVVTADTANHFVMSLGRPDWHVAFDMDKEQATASRKRVFDLIAAERIPFSGYHMPFPAVGYVEKQDLGYRYVPVSYQFSL
jgi:glyoxylase-like metal-dependent hydrolase (beta-lactamase superfamily II)